MQKICFFFSVLTKNYYTTDFKMHFPPHQTFETFFLHLFAPRLLVLHLPLPCNALLVHCCTAWQGTSSNLQSADKHKCTGGNGLSCTFMCVCINKCAGILRWKHGKALPAYLWRTQTSLRCSRTQRRFWLASLSRSSWSAWGSPGPPSCPVPSKTTDPIEWSRMRFTMIIMITVLSCLRLAGWWFTPP